ncbi:DUF6950 family protein [Sphingomonas sp. R86521]|uniref:DUF6950 family protein n=1 Tax=Sphingomonas sp. R86521 TaxID=3093860 RepID=UPI0036D35487
MRDYDALLAFVAGRTTLPFDWKRNDCVRYAAGAVLAQTGVDPLRGVIRWGTARGAVRVLDRMGGMEAAVSSRLTAIAPAMAARGDIAGVPDDDLGLRLMVIEGETLVGPGDAGNRRLKRSVMTHAWRAC